jgi:hypothetical protein
MTNKKEQRKKTMSSRGKLEQFKKIVWDYYSENWRDFCGGVGSLSYDSSVAKSF